MIIGMLYFIWLPHIIGNVFLGEKKDMFSSVLRQMIIITTLTANIETFDDFGRLKIYQYK